MPHLLKRIFLAITAIAYLTSCTSEKSIWYDNGYPVDNNKADVFYLVSVNVVHSTDSKGGTAYKSNLCDEDKTAMAAEMAYAQGMFGDSLNFFSPYYHQYTMESIALTKEEYAPIHQEVADEVCLLFDEYADKFNNGRKFILAGFSQGAEMIPHIIRHMTDEQYSRMAAAYMIGYQLTEEDLKCERIKPATGADGFGETISFNSVIDVSDRWDFVCSSPACCINPANWSTDTTAATIQYNGDDISVCLNTEANMLIIKCDNPEKYRIPIMEKYCSKGNMHHWDLMFYSEHIGENALKRIH